MEGKDFEISEFLLKESVLEFIHEKIEKKLNVKVLFCAETGSRGYGTHTPKSDMDIKGLFVSVNEEDYLSVKDPNKLISLTGSDLTLKDGSTIELDYTFIDIRKFLKRKVRGRKIDQFNLWTLSRKVYIDEFEKETLHFF